MATRSAHNPPVAVDEATDSPSEHIIVGVDIGYTRTGEHIQTATCYQTLMHVATRYRCRDLFYGAKRR
jgi:hypothetical protein